MTVALLFLGRLFNCKCAVWLGFTVLTCRCLCSYTRLHRSHVDESLTAHKAETSNCQQSQGTEMYYFPFQSSGSPLKVDNQSSCLIYLSMMPKQKADCLVFATSGGKESMPNWFFQNCNHKNLGFFVCISHCVALRIDCQFPQIEYLTHTGGVFLNIIPTRDSAL